jgi:hypothetical protein
VRESSAATDPRTSGSSHLLGGVFLGVSARNRNQNSLKLRRRAAAAIARQGDPKGEAEGRIIRPREPV